MLMEFTKMNWYKSLVAFHFKSRKYVNLGGKK